MLCIIHIVWGDNLSAGFVSGQSQVNRRPATLVLNNDISAWGCREVRSFAKNIHLVRCLAGECWLQLSESDRQTGPWMLVLVTAPLFSQGCPKASFIPGEGTSASLSEGSREDWSDDIKARIASVKEGNISPFPVPHQIPPRQGQQGLDLNASSFYIVLPSIQRAEAARFQNRVKNLLHCPIKPFKGRDSMD